MNVLNLKLLNLFLHCRPVALVMLSIRQRARIAAGLGNIQPRVLMKMISDNEKEIKGKQYSMKSIIKFDPDDEFRLTDFWINTW